MNKYELFLFLLYPTNQSWLILWRKPTVVNSQRPSVHLRFTDDNDFSEDDLIESSSDEEEIVDDVAFSEMSMKMMNRCSIVMMKF